MTFIALIDRNAGLIQYIEADFPDLSLDDFSVLELSDTEAEQVRQWALNGHPGNRIPACLKRDR
jgi:hypothetical protein